MPPAAAPSSLTALLTRSTHLGGLQGAAIPCPTVTGVADCGTVGRYAVLKMVGGPTSPFDSFVVFDDEYNGELNISSKHKKWWRHDPVSI